MTYVYIMLGAVAGAPLRYFAGRQVQDLTGLGFPWGTLSVNVAGCLTIGFLISLGEQRDWLSREARLLLVTGFLGSFTTFSAFGWETYDLFRAGEPVRAVANAALSVGLGLAAVWLGVTAARWAT
ncbi:MAG: fluoride efflux transporter CrcB [Dehalococcoidia bacterium]